MSGYHQRYETECSECERELTTVVKLEGAADGTMVQCSECGLINWANERTPLTEDGGYSEVVL